MNPLFILAITPFLSFPFQDAPSISATRPRPVSPVPTKTAEEPFVALPVEMTADVGQFVPIVPRTNGAKVVYHAIDQGLSVFPSGMLKNETTTVVSPQRQGRFRLLAYTAVGGVPSQPSVVTIIAGNAPPNPTPVDPVPDNPLPGPRPAGFAGEVYDQAVVMKDPKGAIALSKVCEAFSNALGPSTDINTVPTAFMSEVDKTGVRSQWRSFGNWFLAKLQVVAPTVATAKAAMMDASIGLKSAGGGK